MTKRKLKTPTNKWQQLLVDGIADAERQVRFHEGIMKRCKWAMTYNSHANDLKTANEILEKALEVYKSNWDEPPEWWEEES